MTKDEALQILVQFLETYRKLAYSELVLKIGEQEIFEGENKVGERYQVEVDFFFDDEKTKNLRVTSMISFDAATDFAPIVDDFIIAPNGSFIGE